MDAEKGCCKIPTRKKPIVAWNRVFVVIVLIVVIVSLCNFSLGMFLWIEVKDLRRLALQEGKTSTMNSMQIKSLQLDINDNFTKWLNEQHRSGRYSLPSPIKELLHETHRRYRRSTGTCGKNCDCSPNVHRRGSCRRCCWTNYIEGRMDKVEKDVKKLQNQLSTSAPGTQAKYEDRLGHFEGRSDPDNKDCKLKFLNPQETYLKTTTDGRICMWHYASWMTAGAKQLYGLNTIDGEVIVKEGGVYFIYGQLIVNDIGPRVAQGLWVSDPLGKNRKELARCVETARSDGTIKTFRTCYFGVMAKVQHGYKVYLAINTEPLDLPVRIFHTDKTAFFGLIKFTGANT